MRQHVPDIILAVALQLVGRKACRAGVALAGDDVDERRIRIAVLVPEHAALPPSADEAARIDAVGAGAVAEEIVCPLPRQQRREMLRALRRDRPLARGIIGNAEEADLAAAPGLHAGPLDRVMEVAELGRRVDVELARRLAGAARIHFEDDIAVRHPQLGIGRLEHEMLA